MLLYTKKVSDEDKLKKLSAQLKEHKKLGWDGFGSTERRAPQAGMIKYETQASKNKYPPWNRKLKKLEEKVNTLRKSTRKKADEKRKLAEKKYEKTKFKEFKKTTAGRKK